MSSGGDSDKDRSILELARLIRLQKRSLGDPQILRIFQDLFLLRQSELVMILIYFLFYLVRRILGHIILIIINQTMLSLLHIHCLHDARRTYLYRLFVEHDPYRHVVYKIVLHLPQVGLAAEPVNPGYRSGPSRSGPESILYVSPGIERFGPIPGQVTGLKSGFIGPSQFRKLPVHYRSRPVNFLFF